MSEPIMSADKAGALIVKLAGEGIVGGKVVESSNAIGSLIRDRDAEHIAKGREEQKAEDGKIIEALKAEVNKLGQLRLDTCRAWTSETDEKNKVIDAMAKALEQIERGYRAMTPAHIRDVAKEALALRNRGEEEV
jgi:hypothetical protein